MNLFTLSNETEKCKDNLDAILSLYSRAAVAFSGGVDSTLLLEAVSRIKNLEFIAVIVRSQLNPQSETDSAVAFLKRRNINYILIETDILSEKQVYLNHTDRCYYCKKFIFSAIREAAEDKGFEVILDGSHSEDLDDYRPGLRALKELGIKSPLKEARFRKTNIRELANYYGLPNWNLEASPCLATRIPYGTPLNKNDLRRIEEGEIILKNCGFPLSRLRIHGNIARIEVPEEKISRLTEPDLRKKIIVSLKSLGFDYVTLDLAGYTTGSMNINIKKDY
jgi:uncharacterized protein